MMDKSPQQLSLFSLSASRSSAASDLTVGRAIPPYDRENPPKIGEIEAWAQKNRFSWVIGVDEAGRGPLAGPVYAAAFFLWLKDANAEWLQKINDSKKLSAETRDSFERAILQNGTACATASATVHEIDQINILQATKLAMKRALLSLLEFINFDEEKLDLSEGCVLVDGNQTFDTSLAQFVVVKGDQRSRAIASASILAKVGRDREMLYAHRQWPEYGFDSHKGYGSKRHREAIATYGPSPIHRLTFSGVKEFI